MLIRVRKKLKVPPTHLKKKLKQGGGSFVLREQKRNCIVISYRIKMKTPPKILYF